MRERYILKKGDWSYDFVPKDYYVIELQSYLSVNMAVKQTAPAAITCITDDMVRSRLYPVALSSTYSKVGCASIYDYTLFDAWRSIRVTDEHQTLYIHRNQETMYAILHDVNHHGLSAGYSYYSRYPRVWEKITEVIVDG